MNDVKTHLFGVLVALLVVLLVISTIPLSATAQSSESVIGYPSVTVSSSQTTYEASASDSIAVDISVEQNIISGGSSVYEQEVSTARNVRIRLLESRISAPIDIKTGTKVLGSIDPSTQRQPTFDVEIGDAKPGTYRIPVQINYVHTRVVNYGQFEDTTRTTDEVNKTEYITITIEEKPQFEISAVENSTILAGDDEIIKYQIENTGTRAATDSTVAFSVNNPGLFFGRQANPSQTTERYLSSLNVNESEGFSIRIGANRDVPAGMYPLSATVEYENANGITEQSDTLQSGVQIGEERSFTLRNISSQRLRVDEPEAKIIGSIANEGPNRAKNVAVRLIPKDREAISITNGEAAVGDISVGETRPISFSLSISESAEPGSKSFDFSVEYENQDGDILQTETPLRESLSVEPEKDRFKIVGVNTSLASGASGPLAVELKYTGDEPVSNANARLFTSDPLSAGDDGAYLGTIKPGETVTASFRVSASSDALAKRYDSAVEIRYDEQDGDTRFTGSLSVGIPIKESDSDGLPLFPIAVGSLLIVIGGVAALYRRY